MNVKEGLALRDDVANGAEQAHSRRWMGSAPADFAIRAICQQSMAPAQGARALPPAAPHQRPFRSVEWALLASFCDVCCWFLEIASYVACC